jgi:hypothetical protein
MLYIDLSPANGKLPEWLGEAMMGPMACISYIATSKYMCKKYKQFEGYASLPNLTRCARRVAAPGILNSYVFYAENQ